jgi:uncharacterized protein (TIGR02646 family)
MKYISKTEEPESLRAWKALQIETPNCRYKHLPNPEKQELHQALLDDQGKICCYCQVEIALRSSHIEHLKPQSSHPDETLNYQNLLASCQGEGETSRKPAHCGHKRGNELLPITPLDPNCEDWFVYTEDGQILANPNSVASTEAEKTIELLDLNIPKLRRMRASAIRQLRISTLTPEQKQMLIEHYNAFDEFGCYSEFCATIVHILMR